MKDIFKQLGVNAAMLAAGALAVWLFLAFRPVPGPVGVSIESAPAKEVKGPSKRVSTAPVKVYPDAATRLKVPVTASEQVIAATQVRPSERPQTVTTTLNTETGEAKTYTRLDPYPWFAVEPRGEARLSYGYRYDQTGLAKQVVRLGISYDVIRVKALTAGVNGTVDSDGQAFVGVGVAYRW